MPRYHGPAFPWARTTLLNSLIRTTVYARSMAWVAGLPVRQFAGQRIGPSLQMGDGGLASGFIHWTRYVQPLVGRPSRFDVRRQERMRHQVLPSNQSIASVKQYPICWAAKERQNAGSRIKATLQGLLPYWDTLHLSRPSTDAPMCWRDLLTAEVLLKQKIRLPVRRQFDTEFHMSRYPVCERMERLSPECAPWDLYWANRDRLEGHVNRCLDPLYRLHLCDLLSSAVSTPR